MGEFLLHIPCWLNVYLGSFSYTSRAGFNFMNGLSLGDPMLAYFYRGVSLTHPVLALILSTHLLLGIRCWLIFIGGVFLTHLVLA